MDNGIYKGPAWIYFEPICTAKPMKICANNYPNPQLLSFQGADPAAYFLFSVSPRGINGQIWNNKTCCSNQCSSLLNTAEQVNLYWEPFIVVNSRFFTNSLCFFKLPHVNSSAQYILSRISCMLLSTPTSAHLASDTNSIFDMNDHFQQWRLSNDSESEHEGWGVDGAIEALCGKLCGCYMVVSLSSCLSPHIGQASLSTLSQAPCLVPN